MKLAKSPDILNPLFVTSDGETRILGQKIKLELSLEPSNLPSRMEIKSGGRHDNDFMEIRQISIMPTGYELLSKERPFLHFADECMDDSLQTSSCLAIHMYNLFRLLRVDMLGEIREELQILMDTKPGRYKGLIVDDLRLVGVELGRDRKRRPWGIMLPCRKELPHLTGIEPSNRKAYLLDNRQILRNQNMACLVVDNEAVAFPTIQRDD